MTSPGRTPRGLPLLLFYGTACTLSGWLLSLTGSLRLGWLLPAIVLMGVACWLGCRRAPAPAEAPHRPGFGRWLRRFHQPLPLVYLFIVVLVFAGGLLHAPNNYDALTYRLPRMLHWLEAHQWHWISTSIDRMNISGTGMEWMQLPLLRLFRSDRVLFLLNALGFLLLPGLIFSLFRLTGIAGRVARVWMWLLPAGYGLALQAGSIGNDLMSVLLALAAVYYARRSALSGRVEDLWLCGLAVALMTGVKASNLPLLLPVLLAAGPGVLRLLRQRKAMTLVFALVMAAVSFLPTAWLNHRHLGDWSGDPTNFSKMKLSSPAAGLLGNGVQLLCQSFAPPVLPGARALDASIQGHLPANWQRLLRDEFPHFRPGLGELPQEEVSGWGLGVAGLVVLGTAAACILQRRGRRQAAEPGRIRPAFWIGFGAWVALLFYMVKMGSESTARLTLSYQTLAVLPLLALAGQCELHRRRWWNVLVLFAALSALVGLLLTPSRPLLPVTSLLKWLEARRVAPEQLQRARLVYETYARRNDILAPVREHLPAEAAVVGFLAGSDDTEYSLWRPFGRRRVVHVLAEPRAEPSPMPEWIVLKVGAFDERNLGDPAALVARLQGQVVARETIQSKVSSGREEWWVVRLPGTATPAVR